VEVAIEAPADRRPDARQPAGALDGGHAVLEHDVHAVVAMDLSEHAPDLLAQHTLKRERTSVDHGDLDAALAKGGGDLRADEPHAAEDHPPSGSDLRSDPQAVVDGSKAEHPLQVDPRDGKAAVPGPGGHQQAVVRDLLA